MSETAFVEEAEAAERAELREEHQEALSLMQEICGATGQDIVPVIQFEQGPYLHIELTGDVQNWARSGNALDALQLIANTILGRRVRSDVRLILDAGGYRERRTQMLISQAQEVAAEVKARNEEAAFDPMPPHERRIIHSALVDDPDIVTYSEGMEPNRRIVIAPRQEEQGTGDR
jgi:spoIIIJ-associated protein